MIRRVVTPEDLNAVERFRYAVYVEEMNRPQKYADDATKRIFDPLDHHDGTRLYAAWHDGHIVGTVRSNYLRRSDIGEYREYYGLSSLSPTEFAASSITTRLMVHPSFRKSPLAIRLAAATYRDGLQDGITTDYCDCNLHLLRFFFGLGYVLYRNDLIHPEYGAVSVLRLQTTNLEHLHSIRSPFAKILQSYQEGRLPGIAEQSR